MIGQEIVENEDLFDAIFDYLVTEFPEFAPRAAKVKDELRREFSGNQVYISRRSEADRQRLVREVLKLFDGRNATEIARRLNIGRATVYRILKQAGAAK